VPTQDLARGAAVPPGFSSSRLGSVLSVPISGPRLILADPSEEAGSSGNEHRSQKHRIQRWLRPQCCRTREMV
jgi:hypothetical protein